ncbi:hypothetical protein SLA2020_424090 [Shorea laevis]
MSTGPRGQRFHPETLDFRALPADCFAAIISLISPLDACRLSLVSTFSTLSPVPTLFGLSFAGRLPEFGSRIALRSSLKDLYLSLCDHPVLIENGEKSSSLHKRSGKKCYVLAARDLTITWSDTPGHWRWNSI